MNNDIKDFKYMNKEFYSDIKEILEQARKRVYRNIQSEMVLAYWQIGKMIVEKQGGSPRADYGEGLISELSIQMTKDYGKGFDATNLRKMRQFYVLFPKRATVWRDLSWSHYKLLIRIEDDKTQKICSFTSFD